MCLCVYFVVYCVLYGVSVVFACDCVRMCVDCTSECVLYAFVCDFLCAVV